MQEGDYSGAVWGPTHIQASESADSTALHTQGQRLMRAGCSGADEQLALQAAAPKTRGHSYKQGSEPLGNSCNERASTKSMHAQEHTCLEAPDSDPEHRPPPTLTHTCITGRPDTHSSDTHTSLKGLTDAPQLHMWLS